MPPIILKGSGREQLLASGLVDDIDPEKITVSQSKRGAVEIQVDDLAPFAQRFVHDAFVAFSDGAYVPADEYTPVPQEVVGFKMGGERRVVGYVWDRNGNPKTRKDAFLAPDVAHVLELRREFIRFPGISGVQTIYGPLPPVHEDDPESGYFGYYPLLTREGSDECLEYVPPEKDGKAQHYTYAGIRSFDPPKGYRIPTADEFAEFARKNSQATFRAARLRNGERGWFPAVVKSKIGDHVYKSVEEGLAPFDFESTGEELAQAGTWLDARLDKLTGKEIAFQLTAEGEKKLVLRYPPEALAVKIAELEKALAETDDEGRIELSDKTTFGRDTARNLLEALEKVRDGEAWWMETISGAGSVYGWLKENWTVGLYIAGPIIMWRMLHQGRKLQQENLDFQAENFIFDQKKRQAYFAKKRNAELEAMMKRGRWYHPSFWRNRMTVWRAGAQNLLSPQKRPVDPATDLKDLNNALGEKYGVRVFDEALQKPGQERSRAVLNEVPDKLYRALAEKIGIPESAFESFKERLQTELSVEGWPGFQKFYEFLIELSHKDGIQSKWVEEIVARHVAGLEEELRGDLTAEARSAKKAELKYFKSLLEKGTGQESGNHKGKGPGNPKGPPSDPPADLPDLTEHLELEGEGKGGSGGILTEAKGLAGLGTGLILLKGGMLAADVSEENQQRVETGVGLGLGGLLLQQGLKHGTLLRDLSALPAAGAGGMMGHAVTHRAVQNTGLTEGQKTLAEYSGGVVAGLGAFAAAARMAKSWGKTPVAFLGMVGLEVVADLADEWMVEEYLERNPGQRIHFAKLERGLTAAMAGPPNEGRLAVIAAILKKREFQIVLRDLNLHFLGMMDDYEGRYFYSAASFTDMNADNGYGDNRDRIKNRRNYGDKLETIKNLVAHPNNVIDLPPRLVQAEPVSQVKPEGMTSRRPDESDEDDNVVSLDEYRESSDENIESTPDSISGIVPVLSAGMVFSGAPVIARARTVALAL